MIFLPTFDAGEVLAALGRATALMGVPTFYTRLLAQPGLTAEAVAGMRLFVSGSAPLLAETHQAWSERTGHAILERYGMTETNMNTSNPYDGERRAGTVGFPLPGVEVRVVDAETGAVVGPGADRRARGPGSERLRRLLAPAGQDGRGPAARRLVRHRRPVEIDEDGYVHIVGRAKDLIISGGLNVYPKEVEDVIDALPGVAESAVFGVPHPDFGEAVVAAVVPRAGAPSTGRPSSPGSTGGWPGSSSPSGCSSSTSCPATRWPRSRRPRCGTSTAGRSRARRSAAPRVAWRRASVSGPSRAARRRSDGRRGAVRPRSAR